MKKLILTLMFVILACAVQSAQAQCEIETINLEGRDYTVCKKLPEEIYGTYRYEETKDPIIVINKDGTGLFQPHGMPAIPIKIWIDVDEKGEPRKEVGNEQRYRYTLLIQYGAGGGGNYKEGAYDLLDVTMLKDEGIAMILGERIRRL